MVGGVNAAVRSYRSGGGGGGQPEIITILDSDDDDMPPLLPAASDHSSGPPSLLEEEEDSDSEGGPPPLAAASSDDEDDEGPPLLVESSDDDEDDRPPPLVELSDDEDDRPPPLVETSDGDSSNDGDDDGGWETVDSGEGDGSAEDEEEGESSDGWETTSESDLPAGMMPPLPARAANAPPGTAWLRSSPSVALMQQLASPLAASAATPAFSAWVPSNEVMVFQRGVEGLFTPQQTRASLAAAAEAALMQGQDASQGGLPPAARANADSSIRLARPARNGGGGGPASSASPFHSTPTFLSRGGRPLGRPGPPQQQQPLEGGLVPVIDLGHFEVNAGNAFAIAHLTGQAAPMQTPTVSGPGQQQQRRNAASGAAASEPRTARGGAGRAWLQTAASHYQQFGYSGPEDPRLPPAAPGLPGSWPVQDGGMASTGSGSASGSRAVPKAWPPPPTLSAAARAALLDPEALMAQVMRRLQLPAGGGGDGRGDAGGERAAVDGLAPCVRDALACLNRVARRDKQSPVQLPLGGGHRTPGPAVDIRGPLVD